MVCIVYLFFCHQFCSSKQLMHEMFGTFLDLQSQSQHVQPRDVTIWRNTHVPLITCQFAVWHVTRRFKSFLGEQRLLYNQFQSTKCDNTLSYVILYYIIRSERLNIPAHILLKPLTSILSSMPWKIVWIFCLEPFLGQIPFFQSGIFYITFFFPFGYPSLHIYTVY